MSSQQIWIFGALFVYFAICIAMGIYSGYKSKKMSSRDFLTGGGGVGWLINGVCVFAAFNSGGALMGNFGTSYSGGWGFQVTANAGAAVGMFLCAFFVAKPLRNLRIATVAEYLGHRFQSKLIGVLVPLVVMGTMTAYAVAQMKVAGMLGEKILNVPYAWGIFIMGVVFIFYTAFGGMKSITMTDAFQGFLMLFVLTLAGILSASYFGGLGELYSTAVSLRPEWATNTTAKFPWISFLGIFLTWSFVNSCLPHTVMRVFTAKDEKSGRMALSFGSFLISFFVIVAIIFITAAAVIINKGGVPAAGFDYVFITVIDTIFPQWFAAIVYAGVFAAVMSSISGMLLAIASSVSYDMVHTLAPNTPDKTVRKLTTGAIVVFGILSMILALNPPELLTILYASAMGMLASSIAPAVLLGLWWKRTTRQGALAGIAGGAITFMYLFIWGNMPSVSQVVIALPLSIVLTIVVSLLTPAPTDEELARVTIAHERALTDKELATL